MEGRSWVGCPGPMSSECPGGPEVRVGEMDSVQRRPHHCPVRGLRLVLEKQRGKEKSEEPVFPQAAIELRNYSKFLKEPQAAAKNPASRLLFKELRRKHPSR